MQLWIRNFQTAAEQRGVYFVTNSYPSCSLKALSPWQMEGKHKSSSALHRHSKQGCSGRMLLGQCREAREHWDIAFPSGELGEWKTAEAQRISIAEPKPGDWKLNLIKETYPSVSVGCISYRKSFRSSSLQDLKSCPHSILHYSPLPFVKIKFLVLNFDAFRESV